MPATIKARYAMSQAPPSADPDRSALDTSAAIAVNGS